jgi:Tol biopolymer transport system component
MSISDAGRASGWTLAALGLLVAAGALAIPAWQHLRETPPPPPPPLRLALGGPADAAIGAGSDYPFGLAAAPDGRSVALPAARSGLHQLWLIELTTGAATALPGTDGGVLPFWSPDGRELAFFAGGRLHAFRVDDASIRSLAEAPAPRGGVWHPGGDIIFAPASDGGLMRWRARDGGVEPVTTLDTGETAHRHPSLLNGGRHLVFFVRAIETAREGVWIAPLDAPAGRTRLVGGDASAIGAGDHLVFSSDGALVAQRVDFSTLALVDRSHLVGTSVGRGPLNQIFATASDDLLIYGPPMSTLRELRWVDRRGARQGVVGEPMEAWDVRIAPIGASVAVTRLDPQLGTLDIWTYEGERPLPRRVSAAIDVDESPVWSPTSMELAWVSARRVLTRRGAMAALPEDVVYKFDRPIRVSDWSADQQALIVSVSRPESRDDIWIVPAAGGAEPKPYVWSPFNELQGAIAPDGQWLAYTSDESGRFEIYVDSYPAAGRRARVTSGGGTDPRWDRAGRLYFRRGSEIHVASIAAAGALPEALSSERLFDAGQEVRAYDVAPDGQRFLLNLPQPDAAPRPMSVIVNWRGLIQQLH